MNSVSQSGFEFQTPNSDLLLNHVIVMLFRVKSESECKKVRKFKLFQPEKKSISRDYECWKNGANVPSCLFLTNCLLLMNIFLLSFAIFLLLNSISISRKLFRTFSSHFKANGSCRFVYISKLIFSQNWKRESNGVLNWILFIRPRLWIQKEGFLFFFASILDQTSFIVFTSHWMNRWK